MEAVVFKYAFNYGPLMIFFLAAIYISYKWLPVVFNALTEVFKEMIAALNSSTAALENSTKALDANNQAMEKHHEVMVSMRGVWDEMRERIDRFECSHPSRSSFPSVAPKSHGGNKRKKAS